MRQTYPDGDRTDGQNVLAYTIAQALVQVLKQRGDDRSRENVMRQAAILNGVELPMLLPGIKMQTSPIDYAPSTSSGCRSSTASNGRYLAV